ncbi:unnamed protein product, partial [Prorocentrum cordatum]
ALPQLRLQAHVPRLWQFHPGEGGDDSQAGGRTRSRTLGRREPRSLEEDVPAAAGSFDQWKVVQAAQKQIDQL